MGALKLIGLVIEKGDIEKNSKQSEASKFVHVPWIH